MNVCLFVTNGLLLFRTNIYDILPSHCYTKENNVGYNICAFSKKKIFFFFVLCYVHFILSM